MERGRDPFRKPPQGPATAELGLVLLSNCTVFDKTHPAPKVSLICNNKKFKTSLQEFKELLGAWMDHSFNGSLNQLRDKSSLKYLTYCVFDKANDVLEFPRCKHTDINLLN